MTDNEKLIEEAAKALTALTDAEWEIATAEGTEHLTGYFDAARRVLAVFEKAHTLTGHAKESDMSTERAKNGADSSHVTPNMNTIRHAWVKGHPFPLTTDVEERLAEFDRALAAHDAEVRAESVTGPDYEYEVTYSSASAPSIDGYRMRRSSGILPSLAVVAEWLGFSQNPIAHRRTKAVPAGDWEQVELPVEQDPRVAVETLGVTDHNPQEGTGQ